MLPVCMAAGENALGASIEVLLYIFGNDFRIDNNLDQILGMFAQLVMPFFTAYIIAASIAAFTHRIDSHN